MLVVATSMHKSNLLFFYLFRTSTALVDGFLHGGHQTGSTAAFPPRWRSPVIQSRWVGTSTSNTHGVPQVPPATAVSASAAAGDPGSFFTHPFTRREDTATQQHPSFKGTTSGLMPKPSPNVYIRTARREDILAIEKCNLATLPENYSSAFYYNHILQWPFLALVAEKMGQIEEERNEIVGYVLGKVEGGMPNPFTLGSNQRKTGHVSSLAVMFDYRRHGIGRELMEILHLQMKYRYGVQASTLHVRCSNKAAQKLYLGSLGYRVVNVVPQYYQDGADAYYMQRDFHKDEQEDDLKMGRSIHEKESALLAQDAQGYFSVYHSARPTPS